MTVCDRINIIARCSYCSQQALALRPFQAYPNEGTLVLYYEFPIFDFCHSRLLLDLSLSNPMARGLTPTFRSFAGTVPDNPSRPTRSSTPESKRSTFVPSLDNDFNVYRNLAIQLIFLCRYFLRAHGQSSISFIRLRNVLIAADNALKSANEAGNRTSQEVDKKFKEAMFLLSDFEKDFPSEDPNMDPNIGGMITLEAKISDKPESPSTILHVLKKNLHAKPMGNESLPGRKRVVKFYLLRSLPDTHPIIVKQVLSNSPSIQEILWNFSRFKDSDEEKRLTLRENPHFYAELPASPKAYSDRVKIDPTEDFRHANKFYVLIDKLEPVYIMIGQVLQPFGNLWCPQNAVIFKDICGRLRGERIVKSSLRGTYCPFCKQIPAPAVPRTSRNCRGLQPIITEGHPWIGWKCSNGCLSMHSSIDSGLGIICTGRATPNSSLLVALPPTSEQPGYSVAYRTHIQILDNDTLLQIFSQCRVEHEDDWNVRLRWRKLTHVCRRWRHLMFDSSSHLDMCLPLTRNSPSIDTLSHLPPLPLVVNYCDVVTRTIARKDEDNVHLALQQCSRVRRLILRAPSSLLRLWIESMDNLFPRLEDLSLSSTTNEETNLMLPETLQAPDLRCLALLGIGLPAGLPILSSAMLLSTLSLTCIGTSCYFPPGHLVTQLRDLPLLEELSIGFAIPIPLPSSERDLLPPPIPPVTLPNLGRLTFRGVGVYLDNLVAQMNTPLLDQLGITLFFELTFTLINLAEFIHRTEGIGCRVARVIFNKDSASIYTGHSEQRSIGKLSLCVNCERLDWQIDSATQVCSALGNVLSAVEDLAVDLDVDGMPSNWENTLDNMLWHELLLTFVGVKKLRIGSSLTPELSQALESVAGGLVLDLLPNLQVLEVQLEIDHANKAFSTFVETRESVGRPIHLLPSPMPPMEPEVPQVDPKVLHADLGVLHADPEVPHAEPEVYHIDRKAFLRHMNYIGRPYRNQAMNLISICRGFIQAQRQTFRSYDELRSVSQVVEDALESATEAQKKISKEAEEKFKKAVDALCVYEREYHFKTAVAQIMAEAEAKDKSSSTTLNKMKEKLRPLVEEPTMTVEFLIHRSLLDHTPTTVKMMLGSRSGLSEVLWIFSRFEDKSKCLSLKQNPHFYKWLLPSPGEYRGEFRMEPIETFQDGMRISVLVDNPDHAGRVFFETAGRRRAFSNVWAPKDVIIFKDVSGKLEGEGIVGEAIQCIPNLWCFEEPPLSLASESQPTLSAIRNSPSLAVTATKITSAEGIPIRDWREPIRRMLKSRGVNIRFTDNPSSSPRSSYSATS